MTSYKGPWYNGITPEGILLHLPNFHADILDTARQSSH